MYYCFLKEDTDGLTYDPLVIQKEYAKRLGCLCVGSLEKQAIFNDVGFEFPIANQRVLLRCAYDNLRDGLHLLEKNGANLIETESDIEQIETWHTLGLTNRQLWECDLSELLTASSMLLGATDKIFLKSKCKGFSAVISTSRIARHDPEVVDYLGIQCRKYGDRMVLSRYIPLKTDSLGTRETRHIILEGKLINSSRFLHTVRHTVPRSHKVKAQELVHQIKEMGILPCNYILDLGEFIDDNGNPYLDIVELNPLSCSMCYVNNSIFNIAMPEIGECQKSLLMGHEFCYDAIRNPLRYTQKRTSNRNYAFMSEERYTFI